MRQHVEESVAKAASATVRSVRKAAPPSLVLDATDIGRWRGARCSDTARGADAAAARRT